MKICILGSLLCGEAVTIYHVFAALMIFVVVATCALAVVVFVMNNGRSFDESGRWVKDSVAAWREGELEGEVFDVSLQDAKLKDVFSAFEEAEGDGYLSMDEVSATLRPVTGHISSFKAARKAKVA